MSEADIERAFLRAAEIAQKLPKNLQEAGFNRAIEQLLGKPGQTEPSRRDGVEIGRSRQRPGLHAAVLDGGDDERQATLAGRKIADARNLLPLSAA